MRKLSCVSTLLFLCLFVQAQRDILVDSFRRQLAVARTPAERVDALSRLARLSMNQSMDSADAWGRRMATEAERSRDRHLIVKAYLHNGIRYTYFSQNRALVEKAIGQFTAAYDVARREKLDKEQAQVLIWLSAANLTLYQYDKALSHVSQAVSLANTIEDDSLRVAAQNAFGSYYLAKKERLQALRNYHGALRLAEKKQHPGLLRQCYTLLSRFYRGLEEYDKAIDFAQKAMQQLEYMREGGEIYQKVQDIYGLGTLYTAKKNFDLSVEYFEETIRLADSLRYPPMKVMAYNGLLNQYLNNGQPSKAFAFFTERGELREYIARMGTPEVTDHAWAVIYMQMGRYDSAQRYFEAAAPRFDRNGTPFARIDFYSDYGLLFKLAGKPAEAIRYYEKAGALADSAGNPEWQQRVSKELDTLYAQAGDFRASYAARGRYHAFSDSLRKMGEEKDLLQMELSEEQAREQRRLAEEAARLERRHTLQYMGITVAIGAVFVLLVLLGFLQVSEGVIKVLGFFSFIFLFEFLILIADNKIHHATHGEPLKVLAIKIVLIAALLPLHHWLEHKVVHYISSRKLKEDAAKTGIARFLRRKAAPRPSGGQ